MPTAAQQEVFQQELVLSAEEVAKMKAKKLATDHGLIGRLRVALREVKVGRTVSLSKLSKAVIEKRAQLAAHKSRA